jgi:energy-coupling factor transporter ATP-binding protein EcfA2
LNTTDREIINASNVIDKALLKMNKKNRGEAALNILTVVRNLNDHIASKVWGELEPNQPMNINKVASRFMSKGSLKFIAQFDKGLQYALSHFTPSEYGAERLMIKYYRYILQLKKLVKGRYNLDIINNIDKFLADIDEKTKEYYTQVSKAIELSSKDDISKTEFDIYYVNKVKPFFFNQEIYYEINLEPAQERPSKFNRITAFTKHDIMTNYAVALRFANFEIKAFDVQFPIKVITDWNVSIRPCEIENFARILNYDIKIQRSNYEYQALMNFLKEENLNLVNIIDFSEEKYLRTKEHILSRTQGKYSKIFMLLDKCRYMCLKEEIGSNILRYLLFRMNNRLIRQQWPTASRPNNLSNLFLTSSSYPFDQKPISFNPYGHNSSAYDIFSSINIGKRKGEILARYINTNTDQKGELFTHHSKLKHFGDLENIKNIIKEYNDSLWGGFKPEAELDIHCEHIFNKGYVSETQEIVESLKNIASNGSPFHSNFSEENIRNLQALTNPEEKLDDPIKIDILSNMFKNSSVHFIYGAAGTGKSRLINHISDLMKNKRRLFLAKTNSAVENLRRRIINKEEGDLFLTIDRFTKDVRYEILGYDLVVIDECSTVKNKEISKILSLIGDAVIILAGDIYQIESIGFGNWFEIIRTTVLDYCCHELTTPFRSTDEKLKGLWKEVRNMDDNNITLERVVREEYSHPIDKNIFRRKAEEEIILCLNYNGLYGLNNINKLMQLDNSNSAIEIGIWTFKKGDPILFNGSDRFKILYNNLKGKILDIKDKKHYVQFIIEVELKLTEVDVEQYDDLKLISNIGSKSIVEFPVYRRKPYASDQDEDTKLHMLPFQIAYAVSIHKSQGLEFDSVKIVIADDSEDKINHNIFYTAITRAKNHLTLYWSAEVCNRILAKIRPKNSNKDYALLKSKYEI